VPALTFVVALLQLMIDIMLNVEIVKIHFFDYEKLFDMVEPFFGNVTDCSYLTTSVIRAIGMRII
jgi:hypothetical protein